MAEITLESLTKVYPDGTKAVSAGAEEVITVWDLTKQPDKP